MLLFEGCLDLTRKEEKLLPHYNEEKPKPKNTLKPSKKIQIMTYGIDVYIEMVKKLKKYKRNCTLRLQTDNKRYSQEPASLSTFR